MLVLQGLSALLVLCVQITGIIGIQGVYVGDWISFTHQISGSIIFPTPTTILLENFRFDGGGLDVFVYFYRPGQPQRGSNGVIIPISQTEMILAGAYTGESILVEMPDGTTVCDISTLTIWCRTFDVIFAVVRVNHDQVFVNNSLGQCRLVSVKQVATQSTPISYENCIPFSESLQVSWTVDQINHEMDFEICGCISTIMGVNQYMGFGLSGNPNATFMIGADVTIAWVDAMGTPNAVDYYINDRSQCRDGIGVCPDTTVSGHSPACSDDVRSDSIRGRTRDQQQCVAFSRHVITSDKNCDIDFDTNTRQYIVWAIGNLDETALIHSDRSDPTSPPIHFGRTPSDQCTTPITCASCSPFPAKQMDLPHDTILRVYIGPSAQKRGYTAITGQAGWGIAWYVNDTLIPELIVRRGSKYTFITEGGNDAVNQAIYHPFYITDSISGGWIRNTQEQRANETIYAGFDANNEPIGVGRRCYRLETAAARVLRISCGSFDMYMAEVRKAGLKCDDGEPGTFTWTPDHNTPDVVYYQCATHRNLGWKITVKNGITSDSYFEEKLPGGVHNIGGYLVIKNPRQINLVHFSYDGQGPDTFLYYFGPGVTADATGRGGNIIPVPDGKSNGGFKLDFSYENANLMIDLPTGIDACDIGTFTIWCRLANVFFSSIVIPRTSFLNGGSDPCTIKGQMSTERIGFENCAMLEPSLKLKWKIQNDSILFKLCGCRGNSLSVDQYLAFGVSGETSSSRMVGSDVTIAWVNKSDSSANAIDYSISRRHDCRSGKGVCPDTLDSRGCTNDVTLVEGKVFNKIQCITFKRPISSGDKTCDLDFRPSEDQYMVWAVGPIQQSLSYHNLRSSSSGPPIRLNRPPSNDCPRKDMLCGSCRPFDAEELRFYESATIIMQIGPTGGDRGYSAITGQPAWGIVWYANGVLAPKMILKRGKTYTFMVHGGNNPDRLPNYHPLYITSSKKGGILRVKQEEQTEIIYAGIDGGSPTAAGPLCVRSETQNAKNIRELCGDLTDYLNALTTKCDRGEPGILTWTPTAANQDVVYYQSASQFNLGWEIVLTDDIVAARGEKPLVDTYNGSSIATVKSGVALWSVLFTTIYCYLY